MISDEQTRLPCFVIMRKPHWTNPTHCTWVVNRAITDWMCSFSIYVAFYGHLSVKVHNVHVRMQKYIWICVRVATVCVCVFVLLSSCATIWVVLMAGLMVIPLSHKSVSGLGPGAEAVWPLERGAWGTKPRPQPLPCPGLATRQLSTPPLK